MQRFEEVLQVVFVTFAQNRNITSSNNQRRMGSAVSPSAVVLPFLVQYAHECVSWG